MNSTAISDDFLRRTASALTSAGAEFVSAPSSPGWGPEWAHGWSQVLLVNTPGAPVLYAFSPVQPDSLDVFRGAVDRLARGVAGTGGTTRAPISVVAVAVFPGPIASALGARVAKIIPSAYYPGIKPSTIAVDLAQGNVYGSGMLRKPEAFDIIQRVARHELIAEVLDAPTMQATQTANVERVRAFYGLVQGRQPIVTYALIALNVVLFALLYTAGGPDSQSALLRFGAMSPHLVQQGEWWRLLTVMFVHGSPTHILFNMTSLFAVGTLAERLYGSVKYLVIYLGAGLVGSLLSFAIAAHSGDPNGLYVGASGAIFGVAGALITVRFQRSDVIPERVRRQITSSMLPLVALSLVFANFMGATVDNSAHLGGLIGGVVLSFIFPLTRQIRSAV